MHAWLYPQWPEHGPTLGWHPWTTPSNQWLLSKVFAMTCTCSRAFVTLSFYVGVALQWCQFWKGILCFETFHQEYFTKDPQTPSVRANEIWSQRRTLEFFSLLFVQVGKASGQPLGALVGTSAFLGLIMPKRYLNISFFSLGIEKLSFWKNEMPLWIFLSECIILSSPTIFLISWIGLTLCELLEVQLIALHFPASSLLQKHCVDVCRAGAGRVGSLPVVLQLRVGQQWRGMTGPWCPSGQLLIGSVWVYDRLLY